MHGKEFKMEAKKTKVMIDVSLYGPKEATALWDKLRNHVDYFGVQLCWILKMFFRTIKERSLLDGYQEFWDKVGPEKLILDIGLVSFGKSSQTAKELSEMGMKIMIAGQSRPDAIRSIAKVMGDSTTLLGNIPIDCWSDVGTVINAGASGVIVFPGDLKNLFDKDIFQDKQKVVRRVYPEWVKKRSEMKVGFHSYILCQEAMSMGANILMIEDPTDLLYSSYDFAVSVRNIVNKIRKQER